MRTLAKYLLLSLSVFLLIGCSHLFIGYSRLLAHTYKEHVFCSPVKSKRVLKDSKKDTINYGAFVLSAASPVSDREAPKMYAEEREVEEDELVDHSSTTFYPHIAEYFVRKMDRLFFCKRFSHFSFLSLYIIFLVIKV